MGVPCAGPVIPRWWLWVVGATPLLAAVVLLAVLLAVLR